jgi:hypothetical protein
MNNIELNVGGVIGALGCGGVAAAVVFSTVDPATSGRGPFKFCILALIAGAFVGNWLWGLLFKKSK